MNRVKLRFHAISQIVGSIGVGIIVLTDEAKERQISVVCDAEMTDALCKRLQARDGEDVHLAGALSSLLKQNETQVEVLIYGIQDGQYCAMLLDTDSLVSVKLKVCDAILFALSGHWPIYIDEQLMRTQAAPFDAAQEDRVAMPINVLNTDMLKEALARSIAQEDYKMAEYLNAELKRREGKS